MKGRFSMSFTNATDHAYSTNNTNNAYRKGSAQYHNQQEIKRSFKTDTSILNDPTSILINDGAPTQTTNHYKHFIQQNNNIQTKRKIQATIPYQHAQRKVVGPGSMARFLMTPPSGSGCSVCGGSK